MRNNTVTVDGVKCIVIERGAYYTKVLNSFHDIIMVSNDDIKE